MLRRFCSKWPLAEEFDLCRSEFLTIGVATMRRYLLILFLAAVCHCGGCQGITNHVKQSFDNVAEDYHRVTTGADSRYIASQRSQR